MIKRSVPFVLSLFLIITPLFGLAEEAAHELSAEKELVKVSETGFEPKTIHLHKYDASVFFVNTTTDSLVTFEIDFGERRLHCATSNMKVDGSILRSSKPVAPKDFALTCFPEKGTYQVKALGVRGSKGPLFGSVVVD